MFSLVENAKPISVIAPAAHGSAATGDWISMKNYDKVTFIIQTGSVTTGGNVIIKEAKNVSGSSAATLSFGTFWENTGVGTDTYTQTSADSSGSADCVAIANSDDNTVFVVEVRAEQLSDSFDCVTATIPAAFSTCNVGIMAIGHNARYQQNSPPTALTN